MQEPSTLSARPWLKGAGPATPPVAYLPLTSLTAGLVLRAHSRLPVTCPPPSKHRLLAPSWLHPLRPGPSSRFRSASRATLTILWRGPRLCHPPGRSGLGRLVCFARAELLPSLPLRSPARLRPLQQQQQQQQQQPRLSRRGHGSFKSPSRSVPRTPPFSSPPYPASPAA